MKPLTESERQALIDLCRNVISACTEDDENHRSCEIDIFKIALAALEAEPFAYARRLVRIRNGCVEAYKITQTLAENTEGLIYRNEVEPLYKAPPVPVIKFPTRDDFERYCTVNLERNEYFPDKYAHVPARYQWETWNNCIEEIKRINAFAAIKEAGYPVEDETNDH